jgi:NAD(P)-dependent dehydrogenase (short-subunit alcohol dehydrogenase family)
MDSASQENLFRLDGCVALVTGAAKGLGRVIAIGLARFGAHIAAIGTDSSIAQLAAEIESLSRDALVAMRRPQ